MSHYAEYGKPRREYLKKHKLCIDCKKQDAYTLNGKSRCFECSEKGRIRESGFLIPKYDRIEMGLCYMCGSGNVLDGYKVCQNCYEKMKLYSQISHKNDGPHRETDGLPNPKIPRNEWVKNGFCYLCGNERLPNLKVCLNCQTRLKKQNAEEDLSIFSKLISDDFRINHMYKERRRRND